MAGAKERFLRLTRTDGAWVAPPELRRRIIEEADADGSNMAEIVNRILAKHYGVRFVPAGRRAAADPDGDPVILVALSTENQQAVAVNAIANGRSEKIEIFTVLAKHFGLRMPSPPPPVRKPRGTRRPRSSAAA